MTGLDHYLGQVLDDKYRLERLLGRGGMGAVYLATHLGTERYVALKLIAPQFMRNEEFVGRFKREARAAGRLRHPNVVDVTDFGFTLAGEEQVAYLVMEYLDGCTLGDVLEEEKRLPVEWVVDIIEQVCSAVHEAHKQGIVHRDLKPDNIWLEPNRLGSYRVKVLDFGIAKLTEVETPGGDGQLEIGTLRSEGLTAAVAATGLGQGAPTQLPSSEAATFIQGQYDAGTVMPGARVTNVMNPMGDDDPLGLDTVAYSPGEELSGDHIGASPEGDAVETKRFRVPVASGEIASTNPSQGPVHDEDTDRTLMFVQPARRLGLGGQTTSNSTRGQATKLTRIGAIMGTPVYMSPEQCAGKSLDARSDIYSLGVITYQMLAGEPPFAGNTGSVIREHLELPPPPLRERSKKIPKRVAEIVMGALAKDPADRPQTASAFANSLRAQSQSIGTLYRRAFALYSEYFPKFLKLSLIAHIPVIVTTTLLVVLILVEKGLPRGLSATKITVICALGIVGLLHVVAQFLAAAAISGITAVIVMQLSAAPLRPVELRSAFAVVKRRWKPFLKTSIRVTLRILLGFLLIIPGLVFAVRYALYAPVVLLEGLEKKAAMRRARELASRSWRTVIIVTVLQFLIPTIISGFFGRFTVGTKHTGVGVTTQTIYQQFSGLVNIFIMPLMSIVPALLYLKMRQLGGETASDALTQIEEADETRSKWQQRMRSRSTLPTPRSR
jgi:serine/threonine protein kinase